jgi:hypothetical protein
MFGVKQAVVLSVWIGIAFIYIEIAIYLFSKDGVMLKVIAIVLFPLLALALFMPISFRRRIKRLGRCAGSG